MEGQEAFPQADPVWRDRRITDLERQLAEARACDNDGLMVAENARLQERVEKLEDEQERRTEDHSKRLGAMYRQRDALQARVDVVELEQEENRQHAQDYKARVEEAEAHDCGYALTKALEIAENQMALAERRKKTMPNPDKLRLLADWFDRDDAVKGRAGSTFATLGGQPSDEVQRELRGWARDIDAAIEEEGT